jgi:hypothetical protein
MAVGALDLVADLRGSVEQDGANRVGEERRPVGAVGDPVGGSARRARRSSPVPLRRGRAPGAGLTRSPVERPCGWRSCGWLCRDGGAGLIEIYELAVHAELVEGSARRLDPSGVSDAARLQRVEAGSADQTLDRRRSGGVVVGGRRRARPVVVRGIRLWRPKVSGGNADPP